MIRRTRPLGYLTYVVLMGLACLYFVFAAVQGDYGIFRRAEVDAEALELKLQVASLSEEVARQFDIQTESGALVAETENGGPASRAGLQRGDVVTAIEGDRVENSGDLLGALREYQPGERVRMTVVSGGEQLQVEVRLGERPESASR